MEIKKEPLETYYDLCEDIGKGQFATVKRCIHKDSQAEYAAKFIRKRRGGGRRGAKMEDIQKEIDILSSVSHRNIIRLYEVYETNREVILLLELVSGGELFEYLSEKDKLSEEEASAFIKQILDGVLHLHSKNIAHLDLKPENILLQDKNSTHVKLIDFGLSRKILPNEDHRALMGTAEFVAPEVVSFEQLTLATDMWSIGVITYILLSGASPFLGDNQQETYHNITAVNFEFDEEYFNGTSEMAKGFIRSLLVKDKRKRANIHDCLNHPWIKPVEKKQRDLRRSSIIKTDHLKKFIARQRWKRSMRVVSLCNRLSRSLQLRRIQSTDTLSSCNEEKMKLEERLKMQVHVSLSAPSYSGDDIDDDSNDDLTPVNEPQAMGDAVASLIAKKLIEDVIKNALDQLHKVSHKIPEHLGNNARESHNSSEDSAFTFLDNVEDNAHLRVENSPTDDVVEVFVEQSDCTNFRDEEEISNVECLLSPSTPKRRPSHSKRKLSDLQDIIEEDILVLGHDSGSKNEAVAVGTFERLNSEIGTLDINDRKDLESENDLALKDISLSVKPFVSQSLDGINPDVPQVFVENESKALAHTDKDDCSRKDLVTNEPELQYSSFSINEHCQSNVQDDKTELRDINQEKSDCWNDLDDGVGFNESTLSKADAKDKSVEQKLLDVFINDVIANCIMTVRNEMDQNQVAGHSGTMSSNDRKGDVPPDALSNEIVTEYVACIIDKAKQELLNKGTAEHTTTDFGKDTHGIQNDFETPDIFAEIVTPTESLNNHEDITYSNEMVREYVVGIIDKAKQELLNEGTAEMTTDLGKDTHGSHDAFNAPVLVFLAEIETPTESLNNHEDIIYSNKMVREYVAGIIDKAKQELLNEGTAEMTTDFGKDTYGIQDDFIAPIILAKINPTESLNDHSDIGTECEPAKGVDDRLVELDNYDPLHIASLDENGKFYITRELFDIPEETHNQTNEELQLSLSEDVKRKIMRQRQRKLSLQRRVYAKMMQDILSNEMSKFRKLRDEKRIESFEMEVFKDKGMEEY